MQGERGLLVCCRGLIKDLSSPKIVDLLILHSRLDKFSSWLPLAEWQSS